VYSLLLHVLLLLFYFWHACICIGTGSVITAYPSYAPWSGIKWRKIRRAPEQPHYFYGTCRSSVLPFFLSLKNMSVGVNVLNIGIAMNGTLIDWYGASAMFFSDTFNQLYNASMPSIDTELTSGCQIGNYPLHLVICSSPLLLACFYHKQ
jgi:hypothetical protein